MILNNQIALYKKLYPNLSKEEIQKEIIKFEAYVAKEGRINPMSANWTKLQRGWLMRANLANEKTPIK